MRILFARRDYLDAADGINAFLYPIIESLLQLGDEVHLAGPTPIDESRVRDLFPCQHYPIFHWLADRRPPGWWADTCLWARSWGPLVRRIQPDRIVLNGVLPWRNAVPTLAINHDLQPRGGVWLARLIRIVGYRLAQARAATCTELRDALAKNTFIRSEKIHILPTCVRISDFVSGLDHPKKPFLLHVGTMPYKHPEKSMAALDLVHDNKIQLQITGPICPWVKESMASLPAQTRARIKLLGVIPASQLRSLMSAATAVLVPSGYHIPVLSPTVLESFAAGAAVICTSSISRDLIRPDKNCLVAESPSTVASHCHSLLLDPELGANLGRQALYDVEPFDANEVAKRLKKILHLI